MNFLFLLQYEVLQLMVFIITIVSKKNVFNKQVKIAANLLAGS